MKTIPIAAAAVVASLCAGCASVVESSHQPISVTTAPEAGADCVVSNDRGKWSLVSPGSVMVEKSASVLMIVCSKPGWKDAKAYASAKISNAAMVGMMLPYVGLLNAAVDSSSGAAQSYPTSYTISMTPTAPVAASAANAATTASASSPAPTTTNH